MIQLEKDSREMARWLTTIGLLRAARDIAVLVDPISTTAAMPGRHQQVATAAHHCGGLTVPKTPRHDGNLALYIIYPAVWQSRVPHHIRFGC